MSRTLFDVNSVYARVRRSAEISECGRYRWWLRRSWNTGQGVVCFIMLNPSTADAEIDDPTIRRCMGFARRWGFQVLDVRNLFPFRATDPKELLTVTDPSGGHRGTIELQTAVTADKIVAAWGSWVPFGHEHLVRILMPDSQLWCLGKTKSGAPRHPLYVRADKELELF